MHKLNEVVKSKDGTPFASLTLPFEKRQICRQRVNLDNGDEASLMIDRGIILRGGDILKTEEGKLIEVAKADGTGTNFLGDVEVVYKNGTTDSISLWKSKYKDRGKTYIREAHSGKVFLDNQLSDAKPIGFTMQTKAKDGSPLYKASRHLPATLWPHPSIVAARLGRIDHSNCWRRARQ